MMLHINTRPTGLNIIQVYAPIPDKPEEGIECFYRDIDKLIKLTKKQDVTIVIGNYNATVGCTRVGDNVGSYG